jgi:hypothetical protein
MPDPKMLQTAQFLSRWFCQISVWILDLAFNKVNFYLDLDPAYKNHYFGVKRVNFGSLGLPGHFLEVFTSGKRRK